MSETETIRRILSGEDALFARLVNRYTGYVWALCSSYVRNPSDCEDVVQEVFVQCYRRLDTLRNPQAFGGWLSQLARRHCLMWLRASDRRDRRITQYEETVQGVQEIMENTAMEDAAREELHEAIRATIDMLSPDYREALLLRFAEGYSVEDAAMFLGITPAAMRKRIERAQKMLRDKLWDQVEPALAREKHKEYLARGVLAAIPFGRAPWLGAHTAAAATVTTTGAVKSVLLGGISIMSKKIAIGIGAAALVGVCGILLTTGTGESRAKNPTAVVHAKTKMAAADSARHDAPAESQDALQPAAEPKNEAQQEPEHLVRPASLFGRVCDRESNPVSGAEVTLEVGRDRYCNDVAESFSVKTGSHGEYAFTGIRTFGPSHLFAASEGFSMARSSILKLSEGSIIKGIDFTLEEAKYYVAGRVVDRNHAPVPDASVDSLYFGYDEDGLEHTASTGTTTGNISSSKYFFARTDKNGAFNVAVPSPGLCDFRVTRQGYGPGFFPKIQTGTTDALFVLNSGGGITGKVTGAKGEPVAGETVLIMGEVLPGGLTPSAVRIQALPLAPVMATTDAGGMYSAGNLGEDYVYTVSVPEAAASPGDTKRDVVRGAIAAAMKELDEDCFGGPLARASKTGVRVKSGQTTEGVDLVLAQVYAATVLGKVTDKTTGKPVCPVVVTAALCDEWTDWFRSSTKRRHWFQTKAGGSAVTQADGSYELRIGNLAKSRGFMIGYAFMTEGGSSWEQPNEDIAELTLGPGDSQQVDFSVDAPIVVPVRYVTVNGNPAEGIEAGMRMEGNSGGCGGTLISGADGKVTFHGVRANVSLQALAWKLTSGSVQTLGVSEPFTGKPGETVPEVTVVCRMLGGVEATIAYPDGTPAANTEILCEGRRIDDSGPPMEGTITSDEAGTVRIIDMVPEGVYTMRAMFTDPQTGRAYSATAENIEIGAGATTNAGILRAELETDWMNSLRAADYGRKGNQAVAAAYSPESLNALPGTGLFLKAGMALYDVERYQDALDVFARMTEDAADNSKDAAISLIWQGHMLDLMGRRDEAIAAYSAAAEMNIGTEIRHDQFGLDYIVSDYAHERMEQPFTRAENKMP